MALPATNLTFHCDAADTDRLWKETAMSTHPVDGNEVKAWDDEGDATGNAFIIETGSGSISPLYRAGAFNLKGCLDFDGTDDYFAAMDDAWTTVRSIGTFITASAATMFVSFIMEGAAVNEALTYRNAGILGDGGDYFGMHVKSNAGVHTLMAYNWDGSEDHADRTISLNTRYVAMMKHGSGTLTLDVNDSGSPTTVSSGNTQNVTTHCWLARGGGGGTARYFNGKIGEVAIYNAALAGTDLSDAWAYFIDKWVTPPPSTGGGWHYYNQLMRR